MMNKFMNEEIRNMELIKKAVDEFASDLLGQGEITIKSQPVISDILLILSVKCQQKHGKEISKQYGIRLSDNGSTLDDAPVIYQKLMEEAYKTYKYAVEKLGVSHEESVISEEAYYNDIKHSMEQSRDHFSKYLSWMQKDLLC